LVPEYHGLPSQPINKWKEIATKNTRSHEKQGSYFVLFRVLCGHLCLLKVWGMKTRRQFLNVSLATAIAATCYREAAAETESLSDRINESIASALQYLMDRQSTDGAWRSEIYAPLKDGPSLTSLIGATFASLKNTVDVESATYRAAKYLAAQIDNSPDNLTYPGYTAAGAVIALIQRPEFADAQRAWLEWHQIKLQVIAPTVLASARRGAFS
jgi:hypothetical protein